VYAKGIREQILNHYTRKPEKYTLVSSDHFNI